MTGSASRPPCIRSCRDARGSADQPDHAYATIRRKVLKSPSSWAENPGVRANILGTLTAMSLLALTACVPEDLDGTFVIVNNSDAPVFLSTARIRPHGGMLKHGVRSCTRPGFQLHDEQDRVVVTLADGACAGQRLTVYGPDDYTLEPTGAGGRS